MKSSSIILKAVILLISFIAAQSYAVEPDLVLVAAKDSSIPQISPEEVRRLYLGIPVDSGGHLIKPLINATDSLVQEIFMQQVLFMSTEAYQRQNLSRTYRTGAIAAPVYTDMAALVAALKVNPNAVTYMLRVTALAQPDLKIIGDLWHGQD
ncbi:MAG: hypothetical protein ACYCSS_05125 [Sulfuriferula sp.]